MEQINQRRAADIEIKQSTILIVDDDISNVRLMASLLEEDYDVKIATTGSQCVSLAVKHQPDLILLDIMLPDVSGFDACKVLKSVEETNEIPVIFVTGLIEIGDEEEGFKVGAVDYITKPVNSVILRARINTHLTLKKQNDLLREMAIRDPLTGLFNRHSMADISDRMVSRSARHKTPLSALMIDIDLFKNINDTHGHLVGDQVIQEVARILKQQFRREDMIARYGGEEFLVVMELCELRQAMIKAEKVRLLIKDSMINTLKVTVSIGVAQLSAEDHNYESLVARADTALYQAKEGGRNQSVAYTKDMSMPGAE